jgi:hypothetical protein
MPLFDTFRFIIGFMNIFMCVIFGFLFVIDIYPDIGDDIMFLGDKYALYRKSCPDSPAQ